MKTINDAFQNMHNDLNTLTELIPQRMKELYEISKHKGINDFGWKNGYPNSDEYDDEDMYEYDYEDYLSTEFFLLIKHEWTTRELAAHRFKFDEAGDLVITTYYDYREEKYHEDTEICFNYIDCWNIWNMSWIIKMIEDELGV